MSRHVALTFRCSSDFYRRFIQELSRIAAPLTSMLKTSRSTESTTRPGKGGVGVGGDGGDDGGHDKDCRATHLEALDERINGRIN